jgi:predicted RNA-binding Zn ribbon-like protein
MQTAEEIPFVGGHVALDFVNTAEERGHAAAQDVLLTPADLRTWGRRTGLLSSVATSRDEAGELESAIDARELLYTLLAARVNGTKPQKAKLAKLADLAAEAYSAATLESGRDGQLEWRWDRGDLASVRHVAVTSAAELLRSPPAARLKQCPGDRCGWLFLDASKRGNRRWCSMSECGQDAKDEQRRLRRQAGGRS